MTSPPNPPPDRPPTPSGSADFARAFALHQDGRIGEAATLYRAILAVDPGHVDALHLLGLISAQAGEAVEAERLIGRALLLDDQAPLIWSNYGNVLNLLGRPADAIAAYDRALALVPDHVDAVLNRANVLLAMGRAAEALAGYVHAGRIRPGQPVIGTARGNALMALGRTDEALALYEAVLTVAPGHVDAIVNRGTALKELGRGEAALAAYDRALALAPEHGAARLGRAHVLVQAGRIEEALAAVQPVISAAPDNPHAWYVRGHALLGQFKTAAALDCFQRAMQLQPDFTEAVYNCADALCGLGRYAEAIPVFQRVLAQEPEHMHALSGLATAAMQCCDWDTTRRLASRLAAKVEAATAAGRGRGLMPFTFLSLTASKQLQLECARLFTRQTCPAPPAPLWQGRPARTAKLRLGYLSADFRRHAMAYQMVELFELHDRDHFEVIGFSAGPDDASPIRQRTLRAFDRVHDVAAETNAAIARSMHRERIDIAIDLNGHTVHSRLAALAWRPAPVQATYLGFPGTSGAPFIDYVIADRIVAPAADQAFFSEAIVHMPDCYQASDSQRTSAHPAPRRSDYGLPETAFVFCCFNSAYKISAEIFPVWMRILTATPGSVLWLVRGNDAMRENLERAAVAHGVDPGRLVFCEVMEADQHLARHALADLYLDTLPYNSHGTGSFALWGGVPVLTCLGPTFAGRVCASLLLAIGLPELVTSSLVEYEAVALQLAAEPVRLADLRRRLAINRRTAPLFDTDRMRRHIERAYQTMWDLALAGEAPRSFAVEREG